MKMIAVPVVAQRAHDPEELLGLLRRQHGGRLVEDEDLGIAVERLDDLDPLLDADREVLDDGVGVDLEAVLRRDLLNVAARPARCRARPTEPGWARHRA